MWIKLTKWHISPNEKKKRDIFIPITITAAFYFASMGIAGVVDIVLDAMKAIMHEPIQEGFVLPMSISNNANYILWNVLINWM